jgi:hypothetical protein
MKVYIFIFLFLFLFIFYKSKIAIVDVFIYKGAMMQNGEDFINKDVTHDCSSSQEHHIRDIVTI